MGLRCWRGRLGSLVVAVAVVSFAMTVSGDRAEDMLQDLMGDVEGSASYAHPFIENLYITEEYFPAHVAPGNSFGVFALKQTKYGQILFDGGNELEWPVSHVKEALAGDGIAASLLDHLDDHSVFTLLLLLQNDNSNSPYLTQLEILATMAHLPMSESPFLSPLVWSSEDLALLYPSYTVERALEQRRYIMEAFDFLDEHLFSAHPERYDPAVFTPSRWLSTYCSIRAMSFIHPRAFELALIPFISTFRHTTTDAAAFDWDDFGTRVATNRKYDKLEELRINYWDVHSAHLILLLENDLIEADQVAFFQREFLDPANLLLTFGHIPEVPESVAFTKVSFRIALPFDDTAVQSILSPHLQQVPQVDPMTNTALVDVESEGIPQLLMMLSRMLSLKFSEVRSDTMERLSSGDRISLGNELRATRRVISVLEMQLSRYIDSVEIIVELLAHYEEYSPRKEPIAAMSLLAVEQLCLRRALENMQAHWNNILLSQP